MLAQFELLEKKSGTGEPAWLSAMRKQAIQKFGEIGFPTTRQEAWRETNPSALGEGNFELAQKLPALSKDKTALLEPFGLDTYRFVFVNGWWSKELSDLKGLPAGIRVHSLREAVSAGDMLVSERFSRHVSTQDAFTLLNTAFFQDGALLDLEEKTVLPKPIQLIFISVPGSRPAVSHPRNLIVARRESKSSVIDSYLVLSEGIYWTNAVTEIMLEEDAALDYVKLGFEGPSAFHIGTTEVRQERNSHFSSSTLDFGGHLVRNNLHVMLAGEGARADLNGLYMTEGDQWVDNHTLIEHPKPHGTSRQLYKGILGGKSTAVFSGKIWVHQDAQKTDAAKANKNLLLSEGATVYTRPHLEILADDVKCTHGAAVGQLDEDALFYLKTRGMDERQARKILCYGFANEVVERVPVSSIRGQLGRMLLEKLG